jgi:hypothetical protein
MLQTDVKLPTGISQRSDATPCVFVVDDDPVVRDALEQLIDSAGWASSRGRNFCGRAAWSWIRRSPTRPDWSCRSAW